MSDRCGRIMGNVVGGKQALGNSGKQNFPLPEGAFSRLQTTTGDGVLPVQDLRGAAGELALRVTTGALPALGARWQPWP